MLDQPTKYAHTRLSVLAVNKALGWYDADQLLEDIRLVCVALDALPTQLEETQEGHTSAVSLPNHANQLAELIGRVHTFADQLLAWGYKDIALQVLTEILVGPVVTDDTYATLQETRAEKEQAVREIDDLRNTLEAQSRTVAHMRRSLEEAEEELGLGELLHALAAIGRGLEG
jgi:hypothetical protein